MTGPTPADRRPADSHPITPGEAKTVVLIHGPCTRPPGWQQWMRRYSARGYSVVPSVTPVKERYDTCLDWCADAAGRADAVAVADYYERMLLTVPAAPILIGHCFGGVIVQLLLQRGLGSAGVVLNLPAAPGRPMSPMSPPAAPTEPIVDYASPDRAPLLLVAGRRDRHVPPELVAAATLRYQESDAVTGFLEYPDACHHVVLGPEWEQIADDALDWAELYTGPSPVIRLNPL